MLSGALEGVRSNHPAHCAASKGKIGKSMAIAKSVPWLLANHAPLRAQQLGLTARCCNGIAGLEMATFGTTCTTLEAKMHGQAAAGPSPTVLAKSVFVMLENPPFVDNFRG